MNDMKPAAPVPPAEPAQSNSRQEVRCAVRFPLTLPVVLATGSGEVAALSRNVSASGVLFELDQQLAFLHVLVIAHQNVDDPRTELAGHAGDLALDVGVVGAFIKAALEEPLGEEARSDQDHDKQEDKQAAFEWGRHEGDVGNKR